MNMSDILLEKASKEQLGHFYIVETSAPENVSHEILIKFVHDFIRNYFQKVEGHKQSMVHMMDHPDVYVLGNVIQDEDEKKDKFFKVEDAEALARFFEFKPVQGKRKFAVITEGHRINTVVANKWLKLFEEPQGNSTIFLLNPKRQSLLPTIHSRAIHLRLPTKSESMDFSEWNDFLKDVKEMSLSGFLENYSKGERDLSFWINELVRWESEQLDHSSSKYELNTWLKTYNEMEVFHQPHNTKWTLFYSYLRENVLTRHKS